MRTPRFRVVFLPLLVVALLLSACGADDSVSEPETAASGAVAPGAAAVDSTPMERQEAFPAIAGSWDRRVIRSGDLSLRVSDLDRAMGEVRRITSDAGGFVFESSTSFEGDRQVGYLVVDVPAERFDSVMTAFRESPLVERVERESTSSQDVTEEYVDLESRLRNLRASEARYLELMAGAARLEDILALERELTRVRGEIEQIEGRIRYLETRTTMSRISLTLRPAEGVVTARQEPFVDLGPVVDNAWQASLRFVGGVIAAVVTVLVFFWWAWPLALPALWLLARLRARRPSAPVPPAAEPGG